jgi:thioredoxin-related protein
MKKNSYITTLLFITVLMCFNFSNMFSSEEREKFDPSRDPFKDLKSAMQIASKANKKILLDVGGEWCIWCHRIDEFINQNAELKNYLDEHYIVVKVNFSEENKNEKFLAQFPKVDGYPHFFVLNKKGKLVHSQNTGLLEMEKSYDAEKFMNFLKKWAGE